MNIAAITKATTALADARNALAKAEKNREALRCNPSAQDHVSVIINNFMVDVTELNRNYSSQIIRGREMIALGCIKLLNENIAWHKWNCAQKEMELANLVRPK